MTRSSDFHVSRSRPRRGVAHPGGALGRLSVSATPLVASQGLHIVALLLVRSSVAWWLGTVSARRQPQTAVCRPSCRGRYLRRSGSCPVPQLQAGDPLAEAGTEFIGLPIRCVAHQPAGAPPVLD